MRVTDVRIAPVPEPNERLKAFATVTMDDCFVVRGIKIIEVASGYLVAMPSRRRPDGSFQDVAHPIHAGARAQIEQAVLGAFRAWESGASVACTV